VIKCSRERVMHSGLVKFLVMIPNGPISKDNTEEDYKEAYSWNEENDKVS
jgi:hypothetical protein